MIDSIIGKHEWAKYLDVQDIADKLVQDGFVKLDEHKKPRDFWLHANMIWRNRQALEKYMGEQNITHKEIIHVREVQESEPEYKELKMDGSFTTTTGDQGVFIDLEQPQEQTADKFCKTCGYSVARKEDHGK